MNQDWKNKPYIRIACGQLLAGSILVECNQALLINCIELYNRKPSLDPHYERFGSRYMVSSYPSMKNKYQNINIMSKVEDNIRLDQTHLPEVGASTFLFSPTKETRVYLSSRSIEQANKTISQKLETANSHDLDAQLRQVRSRLISPRTYTSSRFSSQWTDQTFCRPYTIFTLLDKGQVDPTYDFVVASSVVVNVADSMRFEKGVLKKSVLLESNAGNKETRSKKLLQQILDLFNDEDTLNIIGNSEVEVLLVGLAEICTQQLKVANDGIKNMIVDFLKELEA